MKARIIRGDIELSAAPDRLPGDWLELVVVREVLQNGRMIERAFWKVDAIISLPDCWRAVEMGWAVPADDECDKASGRRTPLQHAASQQAYERLTRGIHPDDFEKFDSGQILGYKPNGDYIPGPNWVEPSEEDEDEE